jgi:hypothetical protein
MDGTEGGTENLMFPKCALYHWGTPPAPNKAILYCDLFIFWAGIIKSSRVSILKAFKAVTTHIFVLNDGDWLLYYWHSDDGAFWSLLIFFLFCFCFCLFFSV